MSKTGVSKPVAFVVAGVAAALLAVGIYYLMQDRAESRQSKADSAASVLPEDVAGMIWTGSLDDVLALLEKMKINAELLKGLDNDVERGLALLGFDPFKAADLQALGIDTARSPALAFVPAPKSQALVVLYVPTLKGKSGIEMVTNLLGKAGKDAPLVEAGEEAGGKVGWVYRNKVDHEALWESACEHAIEILKKDPAARDAISERMLDDISRECRVEFERLDLEQAEAAAACVLATDSMDKLGQCIERGKAGKLETEGAPPTKKSVRGAIVEVADGVLLIFAGNFSRRHQDAIAAEMKGFVARIGDQAVKRLTAVDGYRESVAGSGNALLGIYVNPAPLRELMAGDEELAPLVAGLAEVAGLGAYLQEDGESLVAVMQSVAVGENAPSLLRPRNLKVLESVPGEPLMGMHMAVDSDELVRQLEKALALDAHAWDEYKEGKQELQEALKMPGLEPNQVWDGEFGVFLGDLAPNPEYIVRSLVAFVGVKDSDKLAALIDAVAAQTRGQVEPAKVGGAKGWNFSVEGMAMGLMLHENRLWFAGDRNLLANIEKGEKGKLLSGDRAGKIAAVLAEEFGFASYFDLKKPVALLQAFARGGDDEVWAAVGPALSKLDYFTYTGAQEGRVSRLTAALHFDGATFSDLIGGVVSSAVVKSADDYGRKAKTAEAIDMLDRIHKGAVNYFSTPRVTRTGELLPCQFPESVALTPAPSCCGERGGPDADKDGRCDVDADAWMSPTWSALMVELMDPHYCVYSFESNGRTGSEAEFTATAHCDLDCDGVMSTFQRYGKGDADHGECSVSNAAAIFSKDELE